VAVYLDMAEVRGLLSEAPVFASTGERPGSSTEPLTRLFYEVLDRFAGAGGRDASIAMLAEEDLDPARWQARLLEGAYRDTVGPALTELQPDLHPLSFQVCQLWVAVQNLCAFIAERLWRAHRIDGRLPEPGMFSRGPAPAEIELLEPGWSDSVFVTHIRECLYHLPGHKTRLAFALRLAPERDGDGLGHASLYRLLMQATRAPEGAGDLTLVSFSPGCEERVFESARLDLGQRQLKCMIGQAAGVVSNRLPAVGEGRGAPQDYANLGRVLVEILREQGMEVRLSAPPLQAKGRVQFAVALPAGVRVTRPAELAEAIRARLRLKARPLIEHLAGQLLVGIELKTRPIVFFWPAGWAGHGD
jgi:hypothetical protein